ncbi:centromere protein T isoform X2 [Cavia porcellus]|uniref:centromere protein T isoform X2 n=1 Tax=Cavia porcellus TaxID=10141 RepID=UPI002FE3C324
MAVRRVEERMANSYSPDSDSTTRTLLRRVLDTADFCTPRRRRSARISAQRALLETPSSRRQSTQTKVTARQHFHGARSTGRLVPGQASGHLEEQTPRTLLKNILLTAPQSSIVMPQVMMKPTPAPQVQPSRRESSQGSLELRLPELESPPTLGPVLLGSGRRKQRLRLSMFQQEVDQEPQELPISQEPPGNPDASSLTSSFKLTFATPLQPQSVKRPGLARKPPPRRAIDVGALLQDLRDNSSAPAPLDTVLEDTQPFSHPLVDHSASVYHSLPHPHPGPEDAERAVRHRTQNSSPELQNHRLPPERAAPPEVTEAVTFQRAVEPEEQERSSEYEIISDRPGKRPSVNRSQRAVEPEKSSEDEDMSDRPAKRPSVNRSQRAVEPERSSEDKDISGRPAKRPSVNRSQRAVEPERSSEDEDISDRPGKRPSVNRSQRAVEPERSLEDEDISGRPGKRRSVNRSQGAVEPERSSEDEDISDRPGKRPSVNRSQRALRPEEPERSSEDEDISYRPGKQPGVNRSQRPVEPERSSEDEDISDRPGKRPSVNRSQRAVEPERSLEDEDISGRPGKQPGVNRSQRPVEPERSSEDEDISDRPAKRPSVNRSQRAVEPERSSEDEDISYRPGKQPGVNRSQRPVEPERSSEDEDISDRPAKRPSVNRSQRAVEPERSSEDEDISDRPAKRPSVNRSQRAVEPERSSEDEDISDRPGKRPSVNRSQRAVEPERSLEDEDISGRPGKRWSVNRSQGAVEPERSSEDEDISDRPGKRPSVNRSQRALRPEEPERSSEDEDISDRPASSELASNIPEFLQAEQLDQFPEPASPPGVGVLSAEPPEPVLARLPSRPRTAGSRPHQDPHKAGISYYTKLFSFYAKMPMERKALEVVEKCLDKYLQHLCNDLDVFAAHAGRKTVKPADLELLMRRQGLVTDQVSLHVLVEQHLPLEYRQLLIPCAFSGNSVFPAR